MAACIVVLHHSLLPSPSFANLMLGAAPDGTIQWLLTYTPFRIVWAGPEAVWVFFVLSGFVLVRPYLGARALHTGRYYLRRFLRLYLPVCASFLLARALWMVPREADPAQSWWIAGHVPAAGIKDSIRTMALVFGNNVTLNSVWWSLQWEVWFSILLPLVVVAVRRFRPNGAVVVGFFVVAAALGRTVADDATWQSVHLMKAPWYLSMFGVGVGLAMLEDPLRRRCAGLGAAAGTAFVVGAVTLLTLPAAIEAVTRDPGTTHTAGLFVSGLVGVVGAAGCVVAALAVPTVVGALRRRPVHWVGVRSYSLYLVHDPIIAAIVFACGLSAATWWSVPLGIAVSLVVAAGFHRVVEMPTLALLRRIRPGPSPHPAPTG